MDAVAEMCFNYKEWNIKQVENIRPTAESKNRLGSGAQQTQWGRITKTEDGIKVKTGIAVTMKGLACQEKGSLNDSLFSQQHGHVGLTER